MKKYLPFIFSAVLLIIGAWYFYTTFTGEAPVSYKEKIIEPLEKISRKEEPPPYSIPFLREMEFEQGEIQIERTVGDFASYTSYLVSYTSEGLRQFALMNVPKTGGENYPVLILNHGYINPDVYSTTSSYQSTAANYAQEGFLVLKPDYRGHGNSEGPDTAINRLAYAFDVLSLLYSLESVPKADTKNIFMMGHSMGGDITLRVLAATDKVKAASLWAGVSVEFPESLMYFVRRHREAHEIERIESELNTYFSEDDFEKLSPLNYLDSINAEIIIHHGTKDSSVPYEWSVNLDEALTEARVNHAFYTYEGANHNLSPNTGEVIRRDVSLFESHTD